MNLFKTYLSEIKKIIIKHKREINFNSEKDLNGIILETPPEEFDCDFSSNAAMVLAKSAKNNPRNIAEKIKGILEKKSKDFSEISIAGPGFLNFKLTDKVWIKIIKDISKSKKKFGSSKKNKKFNIIIPASNSFGTGSHESTFLALKNIECILKKKRVIKCFDLGTGTGILTFAMRKITKKKIYSSDCDLNAGKNFNINKKINYLNNVFFFHCWGFNHFSLKKQKFDLIVSNLFLNPLKKLTKDFWYHLTKNGILIISGILKNQRNELIMHFTKFNLKLLKINYIGNWTSIVFQKK